MRTTPVVVMSVSGLLAGTALSPAVTAWAASGEVAEGSSGVTAAAQGMPPSGAGQVQQPEGPNPYLALLPDPATADYVGWSAFMASQSEAAAARREAAVTAPERKEHPGSPREPLVVEESEPADARGRNDTIEAAERIHGFGTDRREHPAAQVLGTLVSTGDVPVGLPPNSEDDGSIPLARDTGVGSTTDGITTSGTIGDGPHGTAGTGTGDFDAYIVHGVSGEQLAVSVGTPMGKLDAMVLLFNAAGELVALSFDDGASPDIVLSYGMPTDGEYYVFVTGFPTFPLDPFDSGSGDGAISEGPYELGITQAELDTDIFAVDLEKGDVLGLSVSGSATTLDILEPDGTLVHGSSQDASYLYPVESPLPGGGNAVNDHIAEVDGWHYIAVHGTVGAYDLTAEAYRPGLENQRREQTLFLDFDGARVNTRIWGGPGVRQLSSLGSFLGDWGLTEADYQPLVRQVVATVRENVKHDLRRSGVNDDFEVRIRNSLEHPDPFGQESVSRVIVGGTIAESGIATIGIAPSIDPGNFDQEETALVLLDILSSDPEAFAEASLNSYLTPESDRIAFVGQAVGNIISHEAGHFFGDWHVDQFNEVPNLMDQGGNFPLIYGVGPDGIGGTEDDRDVDFGEDVFHPDEGFSGTEDTLSRIAMVLTD